MKLRLATAAMIAVLLAACTTPPSVVTLPTTARPAQPVVASINNGSIFQPNSSRLLFEERVARNIGDLLNITIEENLAAVNTSNSSSNKAGSLDYSTKGNIPLLPWDIEQYFSREGTAAVKLAGTNKFEGKGATNSTNTFKGTIAVTVIDLLANGNLIVGGEKQVAVNNQINTLRFTGVINPLDIKAGNTISSNKVADARIEQLGVGSMADANTIGWLQRFFLNVMPF
ncbi:flagellar basal body L-ring protein FlgH [Iodobacter sp.]|uniref:flagellar basal body L-ring protein FlgH n=1 Tax=Iodobacter sp. TaxID=1915058 RepID=UPI0025DD608C|nr:flagellar basal body L-ring protein FlgH [Iodobacter sp.]